VQFVYHVVVTTYKGSINPGRLQYRQFKGSLQVLPTTPSGTNMTSLRGLKRLTAAQV
jgi:hypothetical protein